MIVYYFDVGYLRTTVEKKKKRGAITIYLLVLLKEEEATFPHRQCIHLEMDDQALQSVLNGRVL
jgi:hypothetical protein